MNTIDGQMFLAMLRSGALDLKRHCNEVNNLNVFPVPDGDTGANMLATVLGGVNAMEKVSSPSLGECCKQLRIGSLLAARGNSGVILSQFFSGLAGKLEALDQANVTQFAQAFEAGVKRAYEVVIHPVEGTILTVMREGGDRAFAEVDSTTSFEDYFTRLVRHMRDVLRSTPDLLPILKDAGVIDSGGAGLLYIVEGMGQALGGKIIEDVSLGLGHARASYSDEGPVGFDENSTLEYGYCTEFILQLTNEKGGVERFNLDDAIEYFGSIGDSLVAFRDGNVVKVHVHTKEPHSVIAYALQYGEFVSFKMENMTLQHHQSLIDKSRSIGMLAKPEQGHKAVATVIVAPTEEMKQSYLDAGADQVIVAGKLLNPDVQTLLDAIKKCDAGEVLVFPNNNNGFMAVDNAADFEEDIKVRLVRTTNIAEGYSCLSLLDFADLSVEDNLSRCKSTLGSSRVFEAFVAARESNLGGLSVTEGDFIYHLGKDKYGKAKTLEEAFASWLSAQGDEDHSLVTFFFSSRIDENLRSRLEEQVATLDDFIDIQSFDAGNTLAEVCAILD